MSPGLGPHGGRAALATVLAREYPGPTRDRSLDLGRSGGRPQETGSVSSADSGPARGRGTGTASARRDRCTGVRSAGRAIDNSRSRTRANRALRGIGAVGCSLLPVGQSRQKPALSVLRTRQRTAVSGLARNMPLRDSTLLRPRPGPRSPVATGRRGKGARVLFAFTHRTATRSSWPCQRTHHTTRRRT
jgi:hypothetical protein